MIKNKVKAIPEAYKQYKIARAYRGVGTFLACSGLLYMATSNLLISIERENDYTEWFNYYSQHASQGDIAPFDESKYTQKKLVNIGIGAAISIGGIVLMVCDRSHLKKSVLIYTNKMKETGMTPIKLNLGMTQNGIGGILRF